MSCKRSRTDIVDRRERRLIRDGGIKAIGHNAFQGAEAHRRSAGEHELLLTCEWLSSCLVQSREIAEIEAKLDEQGTSIDDLAGALEGFDAGATSAGLPTRYQR